MDNPPPPPSSPSQIADEVKAEAQGLVGGLADFSFSSFVTPKILKVLYAVLLLMVTYQSIQFLIFSVRLSSAMGFLSGLLMFVVGIILTRVFVELVQAVFKILDTLQKIESKQK